MYEFEYHRPKKLADAVDFHFALDFHCPTPVMQDHQVMYFAGAKKLPKYNFENVAEFAKQIKNRLPDTAPYGPLNWLRDETAPSPKNSPTPSTTPTPRRLTLPRISGHPTRVPTRC